MVDNYTAMPYGAACIQCLPLRQFSGDAQKKFREQLKVISGTVYLIQSERNIEGHSIQTELSKLSPKLLSRLSEAIVYGIHFGL
jgi:hypothetical protein